MSHGKIWAKIVEEEIMQTHDEDPAGLWHPDMIAQNDIPGHWEEVPDFCNVGYKRKDGEWMEGGKWYEEWRAANPLPEPGPPTANFIYTQTDDVMKGTTTIILKQNVGGWGFGTETDGNLNEYHEFIIEDETYTQDEVTLTYEHGDTERIVDIEMNAYGPGGKNTVNSTLSESHQTVVIPAKFVPLFMSELLKQVGGK
jgi:hypothetical protein